MAFRPESTLRVDALGAVRLDPPVGRPLHLVADGSRLRVELPSFPEAMRVFRHFPKGRGRALRTAGSALSTYGLTVSLESAGSPVLQLGYDAEPNWLAQLLGLAPARVPLSSLRWILGRSGNRS